MAGSLPNLLNIFLRGLPGIYPKIPDGSLESTNFSSIEAISLPAIKPAPTMYELTMAQRSRVLARRRRRRWKARSSEFTPTRRIQVERPTKSELQLREQICVGAAPSATYRIALRLLRKDLDVFDVAARLELPIGDVEQIQSIRWEHDYPSPERVIKDDELIVEQIASLLEEIVVEYTNEPSESVSREILFLSAEKSREFIQRELIVL